MVCKYLGNNRQCERSGVSPLQCRSNSDRPVISPCRLSSRINVPVRWYLPRTIALTTPSSVLRVPSCVPVERTPSTAPYRNEGKDGRRAKLAERKCGSETHTDPLALPPAPHLDPLFLLSSRLPLQTPLARRAALTTERTLLMRNESCRSTLRDRCGRP